MVEHPLRASWRTNLLFPLFPRPGPREPDDLYGGKTPGTSHNYLYISQNCIMSMLVNYFHVYAGN